MAVVDTFTGADGSALGAHVPALGVSWTAVGWIIEFNQADTNSPNSVNRYARLSGDFTDDQFEVSINLFRGNALVDLIAGVWAQASDANPAPFDGEGVSFIVAGNGTNLVARLQRKVAGGGLVQDVVVDAALAWPINTGKMIGFTLMYPNVTPWRAASDGTGRVNYAPIALTADLRDTHHRKLGIINLWDTSGGRMFHDNLTFTQLQLDIADRLATSSPMDDVSIAGGVVLPTGRLLATVLNAREKVQVSSSNGADTMYVMITGRGYDGRVYIEVIQLNGFNIVKGKFQFYTILEVSLASVAAGTVTVAKQSNGVTIVQVPIGITKLSTHFKGVRPNEATQRFRYEKLFIKNTNAVDPLTATTVKLLVDNTGKLAIGVDPAADNGLAVANRLVAPAGVAFFGVGVAVAIPNVNPGQQIGVWIREDLAANQVFVVGAAATLQIERAGITSNIALVYVEPSTLPYSPEQGTSPTYTPEPVGVLP